jgi:hypothetical protein
VILFLKLDGADSLALFLLLAIGLAGGANRSPNG